jgi:hypothetical protein
MKQNTNPTAVTKATMAASHLSTTICKKETTFHDLPPDRTSSFLNARGILV